MDIQKEREAYKAALRNLENEFFFATPFDIWLAAKREAQAVPEGFVLMPIKPTEQMIKATDTFNQGMGAADMGLCYQAMIEAQEST